MTVPRYVFVLALAIAGCADPENVRRIEADIESVNERIAQDQEERKAYGKGSPVYDLISLRLAIHEQTLAMLEQRHAASRWRTTLSYTVNGKPYSPPADLVTRVAALQTQLKNARESRESDLQLMRGSSDSVRPQYVVSIATKTIHVAQLEYQLAAYTNAFPPYYGPLPFPGRGATPSRASEPAGGKSETGK
jgi:hypothetical protein